MEFLRWAQHTASTATIAYATAVTLYYEVEAVIGTAPVSTPSGVVINRRLLAGFVITVTSSPKCTNNRGSSSVSTGRFSPNRS